METNQISDPSDALASFEHLATRRAEQTPSQPPAASPGGACAYRKGVPCHCGQRGDCLEVV